MVNSKKTQKTFSTWAQISHFLVTRHTRPRCINLPSSAFGCLREHVLANRNLMIHTKISTQGCETWVPYRRHIRLLESFNIRRLQLILGLRWWNKVAQSEIRSRAGNPSIQSMLLHRQLHQPCHVIGMPDSRQPHRVLHGHRSVVDRRNASRTTS